MHILQEAPQQFGGSALGCVFLWEVWIVLRTSCRVCETCWVRQVCSSREVRGAQLTRSDLTHVTVEPGAPAGFPGEPWPLPPVEVDLGPVQNCLQERGISGPQT